MLHLFVFQWGKYIGIKEVVSISNYLYLISPLSHSIFRRVKICQVHIIIMCMHMAGIKNLHSNQPFCTNTPAVQVPLWWITNYSKGPFVCGWS